MLLLNRSISCCNLKPVFLIHPQWKSISSWWLLPSHRWLLCFFLSFLRDSLCFSSSLMIIFSPLIISNVFLCIPSSWLTVLLNEGAPDWALCSIHGPISAGVEMLFHVSNSQCCCLYVLVCSLAFCLQWSRVDHEAPRLFLSGAPQSVVMYLRTWLFQSTKICSHCHQTAGSEIHFYLGCASDFPILFFILVVPCSVLAAYPQISRFNEIQHFSVTHWKYWRVLDLRQILTQCILVWKWWPCCGDPRGCSVHLIETFPGPYILLIRMSWHHVKSPTENKMQDCLWFFLYTRPVTALKN